MNPDPTDWLVTPDLSKPDKWTYPIRHGDIEAMERMSDPYYHMGYDAINLRKIVGERTVGIMLHGGSIRELEERIEEFVDLDMCYMSINRFKVMEDRILGKVGKRLKLVFLMSEQEMPRRVEDVNGYLDRGTGLFMTTFSALSWLGKEEWTHIVKEHDEQLYVMPRLLCRPVYPISLALILDQLALCRVEKVVLFGADGYVPDDNNEWNQQKMLETYYDPGFFAEEKRPCGLAFGTRHFNETYTYDPDCITVVNCSQNSHINHFPKIGYDQLRETVAWR